MNDEATVIQPSKPTLKLPAAVIFDMDGTMLDTERVSLRAWLATEQSTGHKMPEGFYQTMIGQSEAGARDRLAAVMVPECDVDAFIREANQRYFDLLHAAPIPRKSGLLELLDLLEQQGIPSAVATSTYRNLANIKLESVGLGKRFEIMVCGDEVTASKPDPEIFARAAHTLGVPSDRCWAIEDSPNGVRSATSAGIPTLLIPDMATIPHEIESLAAAVLPDLMAVRQLLQELIEHAGPPSSGRS